MTVRPRSGTSPRVLLVASAGLFAVSSLFPVAAGLLQADRLPRWVGLVDVLLAAGLIALGMVVVLRKPSGFTTAVVSSAFGIYRGLANAFLILLVLFFVAGDSVRWGILLPGFAWRGWLLAMVVPSWLSLWHTDDGRA